MTIFEPTDPDDELTDEEKALANTPQKNIAAKLSIMVEGERLFLSLMAARYVKTGRVEDLNRVLYDCDPEKDILTQAMLPDDEGELTKIRSIVSIAFKRIEMFEWLIQTYLDCV